MVRPAPESRLGVSEWIFRINLVLIYGVTATFSVADYVRQRIGLSPTLATHRLAAAFASLIAVFAMAIAIVDLATYRPRLFVLSSRDCRQFFRKLAEFSVDFESYLREIRNTPARTWRQIARFQDNLIKEAASVILVDRLRARITLRILIRLGALLFGLSLFCYSLSYSGGRDLIAGPGHSASVGYVPHLYFTIVTFFTIGYGDIYPANDLVGYAFVFVSVVTIVLVTYFLIAEVLAAQFEFNTNLRKSAQSYILRISAMELEGGMAEFKEE
jgi:Ion channel